MSPGGSSSAGIRTLAVVLLVVGLILLAIGLIYFTVAADKLPVFMGQLPHATGHRTKRALAGVVVGAIAVVAAAVAFARARRA